MKPKVLKSPYKWEDRQPLFKEGVFYVPQYYAHHQADLFPSWETIFGNANPVHIEYCSGNGDWVINRARIQPDINWVAVEHNFDRVRKIYSKRTNNKIDNLLIVSGEALTFSREYVRKQMVHGAYVNFPDPWPKDRHAKHRLIQPLFAEELSRIMAQKGTLTLVTDSVPYSEQMDEVMSSSPSWKRALCPYEDHYGHSYFESLWKSLGRTIYFLHYVQVLSNNFSVKFKIQLS